MQIGKHYGLRASYDGHDGYYFPTIIDDYKAYLFLFDESPRDILTHKAGGYFRHHSDDWEAEFEGRCRWALPHVVDLAIPDFCINVQNKEEGLQVLELLEAHGYTWVDGEPLTEWYPRNFDNVGLGVQSTENTNKLYVTFSHSPDVIYKDLEHQFTSSELLRTGNINHLFHIGVPPHKLLL